MTRDDVEKLLTDDILYASEVAEILQITPQAVKNATTRGRLPSIKSGSGSTLYYRPDVEAYMSGRRPNPVRIPFEIIGGGVTQYCIDYFKAMPQSDIDAIVSISFYLFALDAAADRYVSPIRDCYESEQRLVATTTPHCVVRFASNNELWFAGLTVGYSGVGPHGSFQVLTEILGIPEHLAKVVFRSPVVKFSRPDRKTWIVSEASTLDHTDATPRIDFCYYQGNPVVTVGLDRSSRFVDWSKCMPYVLPFLESPSHVEVLTAQQAEETGRVERSWSGIQRTYSIIVHDRSGIQVWFEAEPHDEISNFNNFANLTELFELLGMPLQPEVKETFSGRLRRLMQTTLMVIRHTS